MVVDAADRVGRYVELPATASKKGGWRIPLGPELTSDGLLHG